MTRPILAAFAAAFLGCASGPRDLPRERPNFILLIADDLAWDDVGNAAVRTPVLDRFTSEGMRFDRAFVTASSCSPSRASLLTGRYPHQTDAEQLHWRLPPDQVAFVEPLRRAGYWTAAAGKWHLGEAAKAKFDLVREANPAGFILGAGATAKGDAQSGCADWVRTLRERPKDKAFFLWLASLDPHRDYEEGAASPPHRPEDVVVPPYLPDVPEVRKDLALYYDEIARLDRFTGDVLAELERQGAAANTFVLFLSDNGRPFPRCKTTLYDSGIRTPFIVRWPAFVEGGTTCDSLVSTVDVAPTILELARVRVPPSVQGKSIVPLLRDPGAEVRPYIYAERNWHDYEDRGRAVRSLKYKYIRNYYADLAGTPPADAVRSPSFQVMRRLREEDRLLPEQLVPFLKPRPGEELFDADADPHELQNLVHDSRYTPVLKQLRRALDDWEETTKDDEPAARTPDEFDRETGLPLPNRVRPRPSKK